MATQRRGTGRRPNVLRVIPVPSETFGGHRRILGAVWRAEGMYERLLDKINSTYLSHTVLLGHDGNTS